MASHEYFYGSPAFKQAIYGVRGPDAAGRNIDELLRLRVQVEPLPGPLEQPVKLLQDVHALDRQSPIWIG